MSPTVYAFLSGLLLSVATSAATMISFADGATPVHPSVGWTGICAFVGGLLWFAQSENATTLRRNIDTLARASTSWNGAVDAQPKSTKVRTIVLVLLAAAFTLAWPFIRMFFC